MFIFQSLMSRLVWKERKEKNTLIIFRRVQRKGRYFATLKSAVAGHSPVALDTHCLASPRYEGLRSQMQWFAHLAPEPIFILNLTP